MDFRLRPRPHRRVVSVHRRNRRHGRSAAASHVVCRHFLQPDDARLDHGAGGKRWRFGGDLLVDILNLRGVQSLTFRESTGTSSRTFVNSKRATGNQIGLRLGLGAQVDVSKHIKLGAVLRTPGVRMLPGGSFNVDVIDQRGAVSNQLTFFDSTNIKFKYELPLEAAIGAAWVSDVGEIEVNVKAETGHSGYNGFSARNPLSRRPTSEMGPCPGRRRLHSPASRSRRARS